MKILVLILIPICIFGSYDDLISQRMNQEIVDTSYNLSTTKTISPREKRWLKRNGVYNFDYKFDNAITNYYFLEALQDRQSANVALWIGTGLTLPMPLVWIDFFGGNSLDLDVFVIAHAVAIPGILFLAYSIIKAIKAKRKLDYARY